MTNSLTRGGGHYSNQFSSQRDRNYGKAYNDEFLDELASVLLRLQPLGVDVAAPETRPEKPAQESLFSRFLNRNRGRRRKKVRIDFGPADDRRALFYQPARGRSLPVDHAAISDALRRRDIDFDLSLAEFEQLVRGAKQTTPSEVPSSAV